MKRFLLFLLCVGIGSAAWAQDNTSTGYSGSVRSSDNKAIIYSHDYVVLQLTYDGWAGMPDSTHSSGWSRGFNFALMYDFPIKQSHFSFAPGLGVSSSGIKFKGRTLNIADSTAAQLHFSSDDKYKKYKVASTYLEIPVELRFRQYQDNANKGIKAAVGLKFGLLVDGHQKGKRVIAGENEVEKFKTKRYFNTYRVAATARVGWGNFSLFGAYALTPVFKSSSGLTVNQYSFGLCLSGM